MNENKSKPSRDKHMDDPIDKSIKAAAEAARQDYLRHGLKAPEWRDGKIVWVSPKARRRKSK